MHVDHRLAAVEFLVDRCERRIAEVFAVVAGEEPDTVGLQGIEGVCDFLEAAVGVRRRDRGEQAEPAGVIADKLGAVFVDLAAELSRFFVVAPPCAGLHLRQHRGGNAALVHVVERHLRRPLGMPGLMLDQCLGVLGWQEVMVHIDPGLCGLGADGGSADRRQAERGDAAGEKLSALNFRTNR
jgi:hypothetical protein